MRATNWRNGVPEVTLLRPLVFWFLSSQFRSRCARQSMLLKHLYQSNGSGWAIVSLRGTELQSPCPIRSRIKN